MTYILVIILWGGNSTRAVAMQEFNSLEQCRYVAASIPQDHREFAQCFEKGVKK